MIEQVNGSGLALSNDGQILYLVLSTEERLVGWNTTTTSGIQYSFNKTAADDLSVPFVGPDETVYIASFNYLYAVEGAHNAEQTMNQTWNYSINGDVKSTALSLNGSHVYALTSNGSLYSILANNGTTNWPFPVATNIAVGNLVVSDDGTIIAAGVSGLVAVHPNGTSLWANYGISINGTPAIGWNGEIYVRGNVGGGEQFYIMCLNSSTGSELWKRNSTQSPSSPVVAYDGSIYIADADMFYRINGTTGDIKWGKQSQFTITSSPSIGPDGSIYMILEGILHAFLAGMLRRLL
jgi:outer membrane protein assembly factor BamB